MSQLLFELRSSWRWLEFFSLPKPHLKPDSLCHIQHNKKHRNILQITENMTGIMKAYDSLLVKHRKVFLHSHHVLRLCTSHRFGPLIFSLCTMRVTGLLAGMYFLTTVRIKVRIAHRSSVMLCSLFSCSHATIAGLLFRNCCSWGFVIKLLVSSRLARLLFQGMLLAIIHFSVFMLSRSNRADRGLTNVG